MNLDAINLDALRPLLPLPLLYKAGILLGILVALCVGYYLMIWSPLQDAIKGENAQVAREQQKLEKNMKLASDIPKKKEEYRLLQKQLKVALNMLPKQSQIPDKLEGVTWAGKDSGLSFSKFQPGTEVIKSIYAEVPVSVAVEGTFRQLLTFLKRVGEMPRIVDVKNLALGTGRDEGLLKISGDAVTYRFVDSDSKAKDDGKRRRKR